MNTSDTSTTTQATAKKNTTRASPRRAGQSVACGWCGSPVVILARGRVPKWCSSSCRHRAWELTRAAASGHAAIQVVDRVVEVERPVSVTKDASVKTVPHGAAWPAALAQLAAQVDTGRVYDRDLPALAQALADVAEALERRSGWRQ